jgi:hypothetical protein
MAEYSTERRSGYAAMGPWRKSFVWVFAVLMGGMCLRVAIGDLYYMSDHRTFICTDFPCFQKGYAVPYTTRDGKERTRYYCASHTPPATAYVSGRDLIFETPNLAGTVLFIGFPGLLIYLGLKGRLGRPPGCEGGL